MTVLTRVLAGAVVVEFTNTVLVLVTYATVSM